VLLLQGDAGMTRNASAVHRIPHLARDGVALANCYMTFFLFLYLLGLSLAMNVKKPTVGDNSLI
jgi:hypothetical protein